MENKEEVKQHLICVVMGQNCEKFIGMCIESVKDADTIVYCDGGSIDKTLEIIESSFIIWNKIDGRFFHIIKNKWNNTDKEMNGKQRNFYLKYLKEKYPNDWCLVLDADEVVEDLNKVKELIGNIGNQAHIGALSVKMRHFIGDLGHEDNTRENHWVPNRLFKVDKAIGYPEHSHPVLEVEGDIGNTDCTTIWHLGHLPIDYMKYIIKRSKQHKEDSIIHNKEFLEWWEKAHLFGEYPTRKINPREIPRIIYEGLGIDFEEIYSSQEQIQLKHAIMTRQWYEYFEPSCVLDVGCGRGAYLYFWQWFTVGRGIEINKWAVKNAFTHDIKQGDITDREVMDIMHSDIGDLTDQHDLITAIDVLEHLNDEQLDKALKNIYEFGRKFLFSIPFVGDPNLLADRTHKQFKTREEWIKLIESYGIKIKEAPKDWAFSNQILIGEKK